MVDNICKNCKNEVRNNYCDVCGQSTSTQRLNWHYIVHELQHSLFHVDKGIFFTIKELFLHPDNVIKNYWSGKRISYFKPFAYLIILATAYGFLGHFFKVYPEDKIGEMFYPGMEEFTPMDFNAIVNKWVYEHYTLVMLAMLPTMALGARIVFRKQGQNLIEHIVASSYITGQQLVILLIIYPFYYFTLSMEVVALQYILVVAYTLFAYYKIFRTENVFLSLIRPLICYILSYIIMLFVISILSAIFILIHMSSMETLT